MMNISRLKFKLDNVTNFKLNGIEISDKTSLKDFGAIQVIQLTSLFAKGELPVSFTVNVETKNPNNGSGGFPPTDLTITDFPWKLLINDKETISGEISNPVRVPGVGEKKIIPVKVELDLMKVFKSGGFDDIINLVFSLGGKNNSPASLKIIASPVLDTPIGEMQYPEPITIVSQKFN
jgi:hypothetical protein